MISVERTMTVPPSPERVHEYLRDFANAEQWDAGTVSCTPKTTGPVQVGSQWKNVSKFMGRETELTYTLEKDEPQNLVFVGENKTVRSEDDMSIRPSSSGTELTYRARFTFKGAARYLEPALKPFLGKLANDAEKSLTKALTTLS